MFLPSGSWRVHVRGGEACLTGLAKSQPPKREPQKANLENELRRTAQSILRGFVGQLRGAIERSR